MIATLYTAPWCVPCRTMVPQAKQACAELGIDLEICDITLDYDGAFVAGVQMVPTLVVGKSRLVGYRGVNELRRLLAEELAR